MSDEHEYRHKWLDTVEQLAAERAEHRDEIARMKDDLALLKVCEGENDRLGREITALRSRVKELEGLLRDARAIVGTYAFRNQKWTYRGCEQDPSGAHALGARIDAALDAGGGS